MNSSKGYTLIELIVVISLLVGLSTAFILNGTQSRDIGKVNRATLQLESALKEAQAFGSSGKAFPLDEADIPESFDNGYGLFVKEGSDEIFIYGGTGDGTNGTDDVFDSSGESNVYEKIVFEGGVSVSATNGVVFSPATPNTGEMHVIFRRGKRGATIRTNSGSPLKTSAVITISKGSVEKKVYINRQGLIYSE